MTAPNAELAYRVLDHIDADPEQHDQKVWIKRVNDCGTAACLAGWACLLSGDRPDYLVDEFGFEDDETADVVGNDERGPVLVPERAAELLGIPFSSGTLFGNNLFNPSHTREDLGRLVAEIFGPRPGGAA